MSTRLGTLAGALVSGIASVEGVNKCHQHGGAFAQSDLPRFGAANRDAFVALIGGSAEKIAGGQIALTCRIIVVLVGTDKHRDARLPELAERIAVFLEGNNLAHYGSHSCQPARVSGVRNEYASGLAAKGLALWSVEAEILVRLGRDAYPPQPIAELTARPQVHGGAVNG